MNFKRHKNRRILILVHNDLNFRDDKGEVLLPFSVSATDTKIQEQRKNGLSGCIIRPKQINWQERSQIHYLI